MHYAKYERYRRVLGRYRIPGALSINTDACSMPYCWNGCSITEMRGDLQHWAEKGILVAYIGNKGDVSVLVGLLWFHLIFFFQRFTRSLNLRKKRRTTDI